MPKFTFKGLTRGIKLASDQVWAPMQEILRAVKQVRLDGDNLAQSQSPFCMTFNAPYVPPEFSQYTSTVNQQKGALMFPFIPLLPQDELNTAQVIALDQTQMRLTEVVISMDHAAESVGVSNGVNGVNSHLLGIISPLYDVTVTIEEKTPFVFGATSAIPARTLWSGTVSGVNFGTGEANPFVWTDLSIPLNPYSSYVATVQFPALYNEAYDLGDMPAVISFVLELRGVSTLMKRDKGNNNVQNLPKIQAAFPNHSQALLDEPAAGDLIKTGNNNQGGLDGALRLFDYGLFQQMTGGYNQDSSLPPYEQIGTCAGYDVIAVPMWANFGKFGVIYNKDNTHQNVTGLPFLIDTETARGLSVDRRLIPLPYPMTIEHVVAVENYVCPQLQPMALHPPNQTTFKHSVAVSLGAGVRTDGMATQRLAYLEWNGRSLANLIDYIQQCKESVNNATDTNVQMRQVPLVGTGGMGLFPQGKPIFVGRSSSTTFDRSDLNGAPPQTFGCEQYLDIRWEISDSIGLTGRPEVEDTVYAGVGGHWVLIFCKKHLLGGTAELDV